MSIIKDLKHYETCVKFLFILLLKIKRPNPKKKIAEKLDNVLEFLTQNKNTLKLQNFFTSCRQMN